MMPDDDIFICPRCGCHYLGIHLVDGICVDCHEDVTIDDLRAALRLAISIAREGYSRGWDRRDREAALAALEELKKLLPKGTV